MDIHNYRGRLDRVLERIKEFAIPEGNKVAIREFSRHLINKGLSDEKYNIINATINTSNTEVGSVVVHIFDIPKTYLDIHIKYIGNTTSCDDKYKKCRFTDADGIYFKNENMRFEKYVYLPYGYEPDSYSNGVQLFLNDRWQLWFDEPKNNAQTIPYKKIGYEIDLSYRLYLRGIFYGALAGAIASPILSPLVSRFIVNPITRFLKLIKKKFINV